MAKGTVTPAEWKVYKDRITGVEVTQLTNYKAHSHHFYFTENGWYDQGQRLLFISDRGNSTNLFSLEMKTGEITQLTEYVGNNGMSVCLNPAGTIAYLNVQRKIIALDLTTLQERELYSCPEGFTIGNVNCTADGKHVVTCVKEDLSHRFEIDLGNGYVGHRELMNAKPLSRIMRIAVDTNEAEMVFEENNFITHINTSPTRPELITYCHEGPWHLVDHRIWGLDLNNGRTWKIRERFEPKEKVGHEFFFADGEHIGYHGFREDGTNFFGKIKFDNTGLEETEFHFNTWHAYANEHYAVVDGKGSVKNICLWKKNEADSNFAGPRILCELRCSFHSQKVHAHPRFTNDGKKLLFTSDKNGYANVYLANIPDNFESLPLFEEKLL